VTNKSDSEKDMTVNLDVSDGVGQVDSTTESTVSSGETRTGSLTWDVPSDQEAGEYTLTTSGGGETDSTTVEIQETPSFDIDVSSTSAHVGDTVSFSAKNVDATNPSYKWDFDDGNSKNGKSVDHVFQSSGTYNVSATVTGDNGLSKTKDISISITQQNLIAAYDFEQSSGDLIDQTGNGHNGTVSGPTRDVSGVSGSAYQFDGSNNDNVSIPNDSQLNPSQITVSTWVYWTGSGKEYIIEKADDPDKGYGLTINSASQIQFGIGNGSGYAVAASSNTFPKNRWVSVVGTYDGSTVKTYVDGEEVASTSAGTISDDSGPFMFGAHANSPNSSNFNGKIDETEVYNTALSESEVKEISNSNGGTVVEDFDTDLSEYTVVDSHGTATVDTAPSNGPSNKALKISSDNGTPQIQSVGSNNIKYPEAGDTITYYHYSGSSASSQVPMYFFGVQSEEDFPSNAYYIRHDSRDNKFALNIANNGSYSTLAETSTTFPSYEWIKTEIVWETDGTISVTTWDSQGNEIASVSANDTTHTSGGMGFSLGLNSGSQHSVWFDYIKKE
jgi:plastocyanin